MRLFVFNANTQLLVDQHFVWDCIVISRWIFLYRLITWFYKIKNFGYHFCSLCHVLARMVHS
jgi:hypothetical protein